MKWNHFIKQLRLNGATENCRSFGTRGTFATYVPYFADAACSSGHGQTRFNGGLEIGEIEDGCLFHPVDWKSHPSRRHLTSGGSAKPLAAGEAVEVNAILKDAYEELLGYGTHSDIILNCNDLCKSLVTLRISTDKAIFFADVCLIRYFFDIGQLNYMKWIPGFQNIANALTELDSRLLETF